MGPLKLIQDVMVFLLKPLTCLESKLETSSHIDRPEQSVRKDKIYYIAVFDCTTCSARKARHLVMCCFIS